MISQPIVVGVDGSPESSAAAAAGWMIARAAGVKCQLVHATYDARASFEFAGVATDELQLTLLARARAEIGRALQDALPSALVDEMLIRVGQPAAVLEVIARELDGALVVLGGKHHSTLGRWLGGSTVQQAVRRLSTPLLVTAGDLRANPRVLVAVDASYAAQATIEQATAMAALLRGPLRALHVVEPTPALPESWLGTVSDLTDWSRARIERDIWTQVPISEQQKAIRSGIPVDVIAQEAAAWRADLIVVGSHGKGWMDRLLIGSVTEDLLNDLPAAVLVVPVRAPVRYETVPAQFHMAPSLG